MAETGRRASELTRSFAPVPQLLKNVRYAAGAEPLKAAAVQAVIREAEIRLNGSGRLLIRKSGTEPLIRVMAECEDEALLAQLVDGIAEAVAGAG
jgi:phosphoglucosamine mutase